MAQEVDNTTAEDYAKLYEVLSDDRHHIIAHQPSNIGDAAMMPVSDHPDLTFTVSNCDVSDLKSDLITTINSALTHQENVFNPEDLSWRGVNCCVCVIDIYLYSRDSEFDVAVKHCSGSSEQFSDAYNLLRKRCSDSIGLVSNGAHAKKWQINHDSQMVSEPPGFDKPLFCDGEVLHITQTTTDLNGELCILRNKNSEKSYLLEGKNVTESYRASEFCKTYPRCQELYYDNEFKVYRRNEEANLCRIQKIDWEKNLVWKRICVHASYDVMTKVCALQHMQKFPLHQNIVHLVDTIVTEEVKDDDEQENGKRKKTEYRYVLMEHSGEDLYNTLTCGGGLSPDHMKEIVKQLLEGFDFLRSVGIYHRSFRIESVLYNCETRTVKINNFGLAMRMPLMSLQEIFNETAFLCGSKVYDSYRSIYPKDTCDTLVPLLFNPKEKGGHQTFSPYEEHKLCPVNGSTADLWSVGVVLYVFFTLQLPWNSLLDKNDCLPLYIRDPSKLRDSMKEEVPPFAVSLIMRILSPQCVKSPQSRPPSDELKDIVKKS